MLLYQLTDDTSNKRFAESIVNLNTIVRMQALKDSDGYNLCFELTNSKAFGLYSTEESLRAAVAEIFKLLESNLDATKIKIKDVTDENSKSNQFKEFLRKLADD